MFVDEGPDILHMSSDMRLVSATVLRVKFSFAEGESVPAERRRQMGG